MRQDFGAGPRTMVQQAHSDLIQQLGVYRRLWEREQATDQLNAIAC